METLFAEVILPLSLPNMFTYRIPIELNHEVQVGQRVVVQFGRSKYYSGIVNSVHTRAPEKYTAKYLELVLDEAPIISNSELDFWHWISDYYMCNIGDCMNAALPSNFKLSSETTLVFTGKRFSVNSELNDNEYILVEALSIQNELTTKDIQNILDVKNVYAIAKSVMEKGFAVSREDLNDTYKPRTTEYVSLNTAYKSEDALHELFDSLARAPKQLDLLMTYVQMSRLFSEKELRVKRKDLIEKAKSNGSVFKQLITKEIMCIDPVKSEWDYDEAQKTTEVILSEYQQTKFKELKNGLKNKDVMLLHGITGSGKTEIYVKLMKEVIAAGGQVLFLLPEIALTTQIITRLKRFFGDDIGVYHSRFTTNKRSDVWKRMSSDDPYPIVLGARSSVLLPFKNLGLIIVDEEHENTYKQYDPAPRYHARDSAIYLAKLHGGKVVLGSATPSVESFQNAALDKFGYVELSKRYGEAQLPEILVADIKEASRKKQMKGHFSPFLLKEMDKTLQNDEQMILFQNRRGYSPYIQCDRCGWAESCNRCDVSLTWHKGIEKLKCHYCGYTTKVGKECGECGSYELTAKGFGTEKIEEQINELFPKARVARLDLDTTRAKNAYEQILGDFDNRTIDILVGTQMVTKGLDFDNVGLVGILNADSMLSFPDFRAFERSYQLMSQVAGRAGRKKKKGKVIIQTYNPNHPIVQDVVAHNFGNMFKNEIVDRKNYQYPPFHRMIKLIIKHKNRALVDDVAKLLAYNLKKVFAHRVLGPEYPAVARIKNVYNKHIVLKIEKQLSHKKVKGEISNQIRVINSDKKMRPVRINIDVDPY